LLLVHIEKGKDESGKEKLFVFDRRGEKFALSEEKRGGKLYAHLPIRPLIFGGEDVVFVCDGRLALALSAFFLKLMEDQELEDNKPPYTRAGIAIVKAHYPFARAYSLAENLASSAKERINEIDEKNKQISALDWHLAMTGLAGGIGEIRDREYLSDENKKLFMRPLSLKGKTSTDWRVWADFKKVIDEFQEGWKGKRSKVKTLREALRHGADKTEEFLKLTGTELPRMIHTNLEKRGWEGSAGGRCGYFDAIEIMDIFFPLDEAKLGSGQDRTQEQEDKIE